MIEDTSRLDLASQVDYLRTRLTETEEVLDAIRHGQVDAVVARDGTQDQVYTLEGVDHVYRRLVETMREGAATVAADGTLLYCNQRLADMLGRPLEQLVGSPLSSHVAPGDRQIFMAMLEQATSEACHRELELMKGKGGLVPVSLSASPYQGKIGRAHV